MRKYISAPSAHYGMETNNGRKNVRRGVRNIKVATSRL